MKLSIIIIGAVIVNALIAMAHGGTVIDKRETIICLLVTNISAAVAIYGALNP